uniref:Rhodanese domain-containing protein n=1 Tax=Trichobilharzia regenti TaxID=157069 RepID=A0AA85KHV9_TRIRE|nr:unnamed protein product [Trichobilharzia regenti]
MALLFTCIRLCSYKLSHYGYRIMNPPRINHALLQLCLSSSTTTSSKFQKKPFQLVSLIHESYATEEAWNSTIPPAPESNPSACCSWSELFTRPNLQPIIVDVRSPKEFAEDHIHGAINVPVLNDEEREFVGGLYSQGDLVRARLHGASLVCANISRCLKQLADEYESHLNTSSNSIHHHHQIINGRRRTIFPNFLIYCWRGGQRSASLATILSETGWPGNIYVLVGGYRSWRRLLLRQLDAWPRWSMPNPFWIISGLTGSGKSLILQELNECGEIVLDLEAIAMHKGSMFGSLEVASLQVTDDSNNDDNNNNSNNNNNNASIHSITQKRFQSRLHQALMITKHKLTSPKNILWIECESRHIGPLCNLPDSLWTRMRSTDPQVGTHRVWIDVSEEARIAWILENYASVIQNIPQVLHILKMLEKYQPKKLINQWIKMFNCGDYTGLVSGLIRHHYDPLYRKNLHQTIQNAKSSGLFHSLHLDSVDKSTIQKKLIPQLLDLAYSTPTTATTTTASAADPHSHRHHHRDDDNSVNDCRSIAGI